MFARKLAHAASGTKGMDSLISSAHPSNSPKKTSRLAPSLPMDCCRTAEATRSGAFSITPKQYGPPMHPPMRWVLSMRR